MVTLLRILRAARAVTAVFIGSALLQGIVSTTASNLCNSMSPVTVDLRDATNEVTFKCAGDYTTLFPTDVNSVYAVDLSSPSEAEAVALKSLVHKAVLKKDQANPPAYTLTLNHSTVVRDQKRLFYLCKHTSSEQYCKVQINVHQRTAKPATTCTSNSEKSILLDKDDESIKFACDSSYSTLLPDTDGLTQAFAAKAERPIDLTALYPGATLAKDDSGEHVYTLTVAERTSSKIFYFQCERTDDDVCNIMVTVEKNRESSSSTPDSATCTSEKQHVEVTLSGEHPGVAFTCGVDVPTLDPADLTEAHENQEMDSAVQLSDLFRKAGLYTDPLTAAYTYFLYIPYRDQQKSLYYKCKNGTTSKECQVRITVEANKDVIPVCKDAAEGAYLSYENFNDNVKFRCAAAFPTIAPSDLAQVYQQDPTDHSSAEPVSLTTVYSGATLVSDGDETSPTFTLTIPPRLPRAVKKIYYQCKNAENTACTVRIRVAEKRQEMITCEDEEQRVTITGPGEIVRFKCGAGLTLQPSSETEVYDNQDGKCSTAASLTDLVPEATLTTDSSDEQGKTLTFTKLPNRDKALCYSCTENASLPATASFRAPQSSRQCKVLIDVKSSSHTLNARTLAGHALIIVSLAGAVFSAL